MIAKAEFTKRRKHLMKVLPKDSVVIFWGGEEKLRNHDSTYPFRIDSDFYYLTGFSEPDSILILLPALQKSILFCRPKNVTKELWEGRRLGPDLAIDKLGVNEAYELSELTQFLSQCFIDFHRLLLPMSGGIFGQDVQTKLKALCPTGLDPKRASISAIEDVSPWVHEMRLIKSAHEIKLMKKASQISSDAHRRVMQSCRPGQFEYELEAELQFAFLSSGARSVAYESIVASGPNACILHYRENNRCMASGDLVLIDAGCEWLGYASDITRTFPVNGRFTSEQKALYDIVLEAQESAIAKIKPNVSWQTPHDCAIKVITKGLMDLGILKGSLDALLESKAYLPFYMHKTGHWLGLDVHDVGAYQKNGHERVFQAGMVTTVEPGLYMWPKKGLPKHWWHMGIRIEDDVVVTANGCDVITSAVPKSTCEIEYWMGTHQ